MARKPHPAPSRPPARDAKGKASWAPFWLAIAFVLVVIVSLPTVILLFFGMLPAIVAVIVDRTPQKYSSYCVGSMNFAGIFPYLLDLWSGDQSVGAAANILTNVFALVVMYGAAAFGWMVFIAVPPVVGVFLTAMAQRRVAQLREMQQDLVTEWGPEVAPPPDAAQRATPRVLAG